MVLVSYVGRNHTIVRLQTRIRRKMERRFSGVSYMCWIDFHNGISGCGFLCARLISVSLFLGLCYGYIVYGYKELHPLGLALFP